MQLKHASAKTGFLWFRQGIWLFRRNPLGFLMMFIAYIFAMVIISVVPVIGSVIPLILIPGISVGFMMGCRSAMLGKPFLPTLLAGGFRAHGALTARRLLILGLGYAVAIAVVFGLSALVDGGNLMRVMLFGGALDEQMLAGDSVGYAILLAMLLYLPVAMLFWFAPILVAWHDVPPHKALFFSWVACWSNRGAFTLYGLSWLCVMIGASFGLTTLLHLLGAGAMALAVLMPVSVIITSMLYCSFYTTYLGCFDVEVPVPPVQSIPPPA